MPETEGIDLGTRNMTSELDPQNEKPAGGRKVKSYPAYMSNELLHSALEPFVYSFHAMLENDMNNSIVGNSKRQTAMFYRDFYNFQSSINLAVDNDDGPTTILKKLYLIQPPTDAEILRVPNIRVKQVARRWLHVVEITYGLDTSSMQTKLYRLSDLQDSMKIAENYMFHFWGKPDDEKDFGAEIDPHSYLGKIEPSLDFDYVKVSERSAERTRVGRASGDAADHALGEPPAPSEPSA